MKKNKLIKKIGSLTIILMLAIVLAGCGKKKATDQDLNLGKVKDRIENQQENNQSQLNSDDASNNKNGEIENNGQNGSASNSQLESLSKELDDMANSASQLDENLTLE